MIPTHIIAELNQLTSEQQEKFQQLVSWSGNSGMPGSFLPVDYGKILDMVKAMGAAPITPAPPDTTVNHDWPMNPNGTKGES